MTDSDEDEFVSASEGEDEDLSPVTSDEKTTASSSNPSQSSREQETDLFSEHQLVDKHLDVLANAEGTPISVGGESESASPNLDPSEPALVEDTVKEHTPDEIANEIARKKNSTSSESSKERKDWEKLGDVAKKSSSSEDGKSGWDEWADEDHVEETVADVTEEKKVEEEEGEGWDDWGNDSLPDPKKPTSQEALRTVEDSEVVLKKLGEGNKGSSGWRWTGVISGLGESLSSAVESSLGLPSAQELAKRHAEEEKRAREQIGDVAYVDGRPSSSSFGAFGMLTGMVTGGIDVLESIGKKTFETITVREQDKGRRRFIFEAERGENLSDVLKELRERKNAEAASYSLNSESEPRLPDLASSFERSDGMIHLEALELVAGGRPKPKPSLQRRLQSQLDNESVDGGDCEGILSDELEEAVKATGLPYSVDAIVALDKELENSLRTKNHMGAQELFKDGVTALMKFTAASVHLVSKLSSLLAVMGGSDFTPFLSTYRVLGCRCSHLANLYMLAISASESSSEADELAMQIIVEATTAIDFIKQAHLLLIPLLQSE